MALFTGVLEGRGNRLERTGTRETGLRFTGATPQGAVRVILTQPEQGGQVRCTIELLEHLGAGRYAIIYDGPIGAEIATPCERLAATIRSLEGRAKDKAVLALKAAKGEPEKPPKAASAPADKRMELKRELHQSLYACRYKKPVVEKTVRKLLEEVGDALAGKTGKNLAPRAHEIARELELRTPQP
jgi:hypothetical protein